MEDGDTKGDWPTADQLGAQVYILEKNGTAWRLDPNFHGDKKNNPNHWNVHAGKCSWVKKYKPT
jgi:hypothetical protein